MGIRPHFFLRNFEMYLDDADIAVANLSLEELGLTISEEASFNPLSFIQTVITIYNWIQRIKDSSGKKEYYRASKLFKSAQKANFKYGLENAIKISDKNAVISYLLTHREDKFKQLFKSVEKLVDNSEYTLQGTTNDPRGIAKFIADDMANYPKLRDNYTFKIKEPILNTMDSTSYDKLNSLLLNAFVKTGAAPFLAPFSGWENIELRFESMLKTADELVKSSTARNTVSLNYTSRNIATLAMTELDFNSTSYDARSTGELGKVIIKYLTIAFSKEAWNSKRVIATQMDIFLGLSKEIVKANKELVANCIGPVNKYTEELIKLTDSKDFKIR